MDSKKAVVLKGIQKSFGNNLVIKGLDLEIDRGSMVAIVGPSGSGKTTLLRMINGFVIPDEGKVYVNGEELNLSNVRRIRKKVGMVYQLFNLVERLSVLENVLIGSLGRYDGILTSILPVVGFFPKREREKALEILDFVGLYNKAYERVDRLSGGQKQRVAIARALMQEPSILLADEPVANLDPRTGRVIMELFTRINRERGITVVCVLHHVEYLKDFFNRAVALADGVIIYDGPTTEISNKVLRELYNIEAESGECILKSDITISEVSLQK